MGYHQGIPSPPPPNCSRKDHSVFDQVEELPQSSLKHLLAVSAAATLVAVLAVGMYVFFNVEQSHASGEILLLTAYPFHAEKKAPTLAQILAKRAKLPDESIVLTEVTISNKNESPISIDKVRAVMSEKDEQWWSEPISPQDFSRLFIAYPELKPLRVDPIPPNATIAPGQSVHGLLIFHFPFSLVEWDKRSEFKVNVALSTGKILSLPYTKPSDVPPDADGSSSTPDHAEPVSAE
jgi:hypothetical protein